MQGVKAVSGSKAEEEKKATTPLAINLDGERNWITEMETGPRKNETATRSTATDRVCATGGTGGRVRHEPSRPGGHGCTEPDTCRTTM